jgi:carboxymethylenebutenolidase
MKGEVERAAIALYDRFTHEGMDRRVFMAALTRLAGGAAAATTLMSSVACHAAAAPLVAPDDPRIRSQQLDWAARPGRAYHGYNAAPAGSRAGLPVVLVVHENRGLNDHIRDVARRLAIAGFSAIAPDFLSPAGGTPADEDQARTMIGQLDMAETVADGAATIGWLASAQGGGRKVGLVGFCWGGAMVDRLAIAAGPALKAGVSFYGPAPDPSEAARVEAAMLIILAGLDARVNATAGPWVEALRAAGKTVESTTYAGVNHAFHNDTSAARYDRAAAEQAWAATLAFLRRHLR